jgi:site-specific recombinase XerD
MAAMRSHARGQTTVVSRPAARRRRPPIRTAYDHFRLERQGDLVSETTLDFYDAMVLPFLTWLDGEGVERFDHLVVDHARMYRARLASTPGRHGRLLRPDTLHDSHRAIGTFLRWACREGYPVDARIFDLAAPRVPDQEPTVYHIAQLRKVLAACNPVVPTEDLIVRLLIGSGIRRAEVCGLSVMAPDGLSDLMVDSMQRGRVELRVRWDAGAKGGKSRHVPITPKLAAALHRYEGRHRPDVECPNLLISEHGRPYTGDGIDSMMDRLKARVGFRVHAHAFRHTFATVATKLGWNVEYLRAAMGHRDYAVLQRYVRLSRSATWGRARSGSNSSWPTRSRSGRSHGEQGEAARADPGVAVQGVRPGDDRRRRPALVLLPQAGRHDGGRRSHRGRGRLGRRVRGRRRGLTRRSDGPGRVGRPVRLPAGRSGPFRLRVVPQQSLCFAATDAPVAARQAPRVERPRLDVADHRRAADAKQLGGLASRQPLTRHQPRLVLRD